MNRHSKFRRTVWRYYRAHGRRFPWRRTRNPYRILVSEIMLQQTQTDRVVGYYQKFLKQFPTIAALARAPLREVLAAWQGLGYNRRALMLKRLAEVVTKRHRGRLPKTEVELRALPGIGAYTAAAVLAFAHNQPTVFIYHFFPRKRRVTDAHVRSLVTATVDQKNPREWYWALMDYGVFLKKQHGNASRRSAHHTRQTKFEGSDRQIRGAIVRLLTGTRGMTARTLEARVDAEPERVQRIVQQLKTEGFIAQRNEKYSIV